MDNISLNIFAEISRFVGHSELLELRRVSKAIKAKVNSTVRVLRQDAESALEDLRNSPELRDYDLMLPMKAACENQLAFLSYRDITEVKSFSQPPASVQDVVTVAVMVVRRLKTTADITWRDCKVEMANPHFMSKLSAIDFAYLRDPEVQGQLSALQAKYSVDQMKCASKAASTLLLKLQGLQNYAIFEGCFKISQLEGVITKLLKIESLGAAS
jgi:hypothetical protein